MIPGPGHPAPPALSVIIPLYQSRATIDRALRSALADTVAGGLEVVVVNDGSTDDGPAIVESIARSDPRVRIIHQPNAGLAAARNTGLNAARGTWLRFLDADDWFPPDGSARLIAAATRGNLPAACGTLALADAHAGDLGRECPVNPGPDGTLSLDDFLGGNRAGVGAVAIRRDALGDLRFDPSLPVCEDWDCWIRLCERGLRFAACAGEPVAHYRVNPAGLSKRYGTMLTTGAAIVRAGFARARSARAPVDASPEREAGALRGLALEWSTMHALAKGDCTTALEMLRIVPPRPIAPEQAAHTAFWAALLALGLRPEIDTASALEWMERTVGWWAHLERRSLMAHGGARAAWAALHELIVHPRDVARACLDLATESLPRSITIIGAGRNGRTLAEIAAERHIECAWRDAALDRAEPRPTWLPSSARVEPTSAPVPPDAGVIISIARDDLSAFRHLAHAVRWNDVRRRLASRLAATPSHAAIAPPALAFTRSTRPAAITCIIPMFNAAATVAESLDCLMAQSFTDWECVVIDDGSTDAGPDIVRSYMAREPRVRMVRQDNRGLAGARNAGLEEALRAGTEFIHFLDSDDWIAPNAFELLIPAARATGGAYGGFEFCGPDGRSLGRQGPISAPIVGLDEQLEWNRTVTHAHVFASSMLGDVRFDESLRVCEDYDLWLRLAIRGERWRGVERSIAGYRLRPSSMSKQFDAMAECMERVVAKAFAEAARAGWAGRVDLSEQRRRRVSGRAALLYATMRALLDPDPAKGAAADLLRPRLRTPAFNPAELAQQASTALLLGACTGPDVDGERERAWLAALVRWWSRCVEERWLEPGGVEAALDEFSRKIVHPDRVCESLLGAVPSDGKLVVLGADRNGRRLARAAAARARDAIVYDDASPPEEIALLEPLPGVSLVRSAPALAAALGATAGSSRWIICNPSPAGGPAARELALSVGVRAPDIHAWAAHRDRLGAANLAHMLHALGSDSLIRPVQRVA